MNRYDFRVRMADRLADCIIVVGSCFVVLWMLLAGPQ